MALRARCAADHCDRQATAVLWPQSVQLGPFALGGSVTDTIDRDTDLSLDAAYYLYDRDLMQPGYVDSPQTSAPLADLGASLRIQYKLALDGSQRLKLCVKLAAAAQVSRSYEHANTGSAGLGAQSSW